MKTFQRIPVILILLLLLVPNGNRIARPETGDNYQFIARLVADQENITFGRSVSISGDTLAVGDPNAILNGIDSGAVTIFQHAVGGSGRWGKVIHLVPSDAAAGMFFGRDVALDGDRLVVGAPYANDFGEKSGSIYIFERNSGGPNTWGQVAKITASDAGIYDEFGRSVALDGDLAAAASSINPPGGRVYIYQRDAGGAGNWGEIAQLAPDPPGWGASFGISLDMDGELLAAGAYAGGDYAGYAYVFQYQPDSKQWNRLVRFRASDTAAYDYFGYSIAISGWTVLSGAPGVNGLTGAAYIFQGDASQPDAWIEQARLSASDGAAQDYFGIESDLSGDTAIIGAPYHAQESGAVYIYQRDQGGVNQWGEFQSLVGSEPGTGEIFGYATSYDGNLLAVGAPGESLDGTAYLFGKNPGWFTFLPLQFH